MPLAAETARLPSSGRDWHRRVFFLAGPIILSNLSTPLLGAVDTAVVGRLSDPAYIGAVAVGALVFSFLYWGFGFLRMGTTGFVAQAYGADNKAELTAALGRPLLLAASLGALLIVLQGPISAIAFWAIDTSETVEILAERYLSIRIWSAPAALANYALLGWLLGTQRTRLALLLQVWMNGLNIALDIFFVTGLGWDVGGVAFATAISEASAAAVGLVLVLRLLPSGSRWNSALVLRRDRLVALLRVNLDIFIRTLALLLAFGTFTSYGGGMGDVTLAGNAILMQLQYFAAYGLDGFAHAAEILAGASVGAGSRSAFRRTVEITTWWAGGIALAMALLYGLAGTQLIALFTDQEVTRRAAAAYLPWLVASPLISVWSFQLDGIFIGATRTAAMRNAMLVSLAAFLLASGFLVPRFGNDGLWAAFLILMAMRGLTLAVAYPALERSVAAVEEAAPS
ncbi:MAG: MATE family efflux transporter [Kiloniellales bacterium]